LPGNLNFIFSPRNPFPALKRIFLSLLLATFLPALAIAHSGANNRAAAPDASFSWSADRKLCWQDFKGTAPANQMEHVAAITACGMGYFTNSVMAHERPVVTVYNSFYLQDSWVRHDDADDRVLNHEQGHFDLCEVYTRILRREIANANITGANMKRELERIYTSVNREYEARQQAYEAETGHGTIAAAQQQWNVWITGQLQQNYSWASR